jgi:hypothetical protein
MNTTNRTVTSREYKLLLRPDRFRERRRGAAALWSLVEFLIQERQGNEIYQEQDEELRRLTWFLDTPATEFQRRGLTLRVRQEPDEDDPFKLTLKFRDPDRYVAAGQDLACTRPVKDKDNKFEEDILPPFNSKFSRSVSFRAGELPPLATLGQASDLFPGLAALGIPAGTPLGMVNGFQAREIAHRIGQLHFVRMPVARGSKPDFLVKCCLTFWYLLGEADEWPLTTEFSFDYDLPDADPDHPDRLEQFSPEVVAGTNLFFRALQQQAGWLEGSGTTKTAYAYDTL